MSLGADGDLSRRDGHAHRHRGLDDRGAQPRGRRRLLLARALLSRSPIILLDEPTEHLDTGSADVVLRDILTPGRLFGADRTVVVATHHLPPDIGCPQLNIDRGRYPGCQSAASGLMGVQRHD